MHAFERGNVCRGKCQWFFVAFGKGDCMKVAVEDSYFSMYIQEKKFIVNLCRKINKGSRKKKMGALTSKLLTFKMRPWEASSLRTIAVGEKFFFGINVDIVGKKIKRILPAIVCDEWLENMFRFVRTEKVGKKGIINFFWKEKSLLYFFVFNYRTLYQKEKGLKKCVGIMKKKIKEKQKVIIMVGNTMDNKVIALVRSLSFLKNVLKNLSVLFLYARKENLILKNIPSFEGGDGVNISNFFWKNKKILSKNLDIYDSFQNITWKIKRNIMERVELMGKGIGNNINVIKKLSEGLLNSFICFSGFSHYIKFISKKKSLIVEGPVNLPLILNNRHVNVMKKKRNTSLFLLNTRHVLSSRSNNEVYFFSSSRVSVLFENIILSISSHWGDYRSYIDIGGKFKKGYPILLHALPAENTLMLLFFDDKNIVIEEEESDIDSDVESDIMTLMESHQSHYVAAAKRLKYIQEKINAARNR
jgi:hypothetical protein